MARVSMQYFRYIDMGQHSDVNSFMSNLACITPYLKQISSLRPVSCFLFIAGRQSGRTHLHETLQHRKPKRRTQRYSKDTGH